VVREALGWRGRAALLKGRANYLCLHRLDLAAADPDVDRSVVDALRSWGRRTRTGDIAEFDEIPERHAIWPKVTSTPDNCLGQDCPHLDACWVLRARRAAQEADLVVVNHYLFLADLALREEGFEDFLPAFDAFVFDEAHQLPGIAPAFFGESLSSRQLQDLVRDVKTEQLQGAPDVSVLRELADGLKNAVLALRERLGQTARRGGWEEGPGAVPEALESLAGALADLQRGLEAQTGRSRGLDACAARAAALLRRLELLRTEEDDAVRWFEVARRGFVLYRTPVEVAESFVTHRDRFRAAWVFTSATLSVDGRFDHFTETLGLEGARELHLDSPFDYERNALLYVPKGLPDPNDPAHTDAVVEAALPLIRAWGGRSFLLFTSHRALERAAQRLQGHCAFPLLVQGAAPRRELLERFREAGGAVLLGTSSFWEGVDVQGGALSCVVIDRLPFGPPGDPLARARMDALRRRGGNPFRELQIPQAVIQLKQGAGRLIRGEDDRGVLAICDPRLTTRPYGRVFLRSLPPMPATRSLDEVIAFIAGEAPPG
jgi:ATP-dependent DNA helicase DinG